MIGLGVELGEEFGFVLVGGGGISGGGGVDEAFEAGEGLAGQVDKLGGGGVNGRYQIFTVIHNLMHQPNLMGFGSGDDAASE